MKLYNINKLPNTPGILIFYISMGKIGNGQSAKKCYKYAKYFFENKITTPKIGINIVYSDTLYCYSNNEAAQMKNKYFSLMHSHKYNFLKILKQNINFFARNIYIYDMESIIVRIKNILNLIWKN